MLLTEKGKPQSFNEIVTLVRSLVVFYMKWRVFILAYIKQKWQHGIFIKEKYIRDVRK